MTKKIFFTILFILLIGVNILLSFFSLRWDLSQGGVYSLSPSSKRILKTLDKKLTIKFYASGNIPTRLLPLKRDVVDLLREYERNRRGKIEVKILDPEKDDKIKEEAQKDGLTPIQFSQMESNKYAIAAGYFGLVFSYSDKNEIIPQLTDLSGLEYNLTAKIYKLTKKQLPQVLVLGKNWVFNPQQDDLYAFKKIGNDQFSFEFLDEIKEETKLKDYSTVIVFDNGQKEYKDDEKEKLAEYLNHGGKIFAFVDGVWISDQSLITSEAKHNLFDFFEKRGLKINKNLVLSTAAELVSFGNQTVQFLSTYPFWIKTNRVDEKSSIFSNIHSLTFPWVSSLTLKNQSNWQSRPLVFSTNQSWEEKFASESGGIVLNPQLIQKPERKKFNSFILAAESKNNKKGEIVLIPSTRFIQEQYLSVRNNNLDLALNILNELASKGALSGIAQRAVTFYLLPELPEGQKDVFKYLNIFFLPLIFGIYGGIRIVKRR